MTSCHEIQEILSPYLDGELEADATATVKGHLDGCADCRADLALLRATVGSLRRISDVPPPAGILHGVRKGLAPRPWYRRLFGRGFLSGATIPVGAVATLFVAGGIFLLTERFPEISQRPNLNAPRTPVDKAPRLEKSFPEVKNTPAEKDVLATNGAKSEMRDVEDSFADLPAPVETGERRIGKPAAEAVFHGETGKGATGPAKRDAPENERLAPVAEIPAAPPAPPAPSAAPAEPAVSVPLPLSSKVVEGKSAASGSPAVGRALEAAVPALKKEESFAAPLVQAKRKRSAAAVSQSPSRADTPPLPLDDKDRGSVRIEAEGEVSSFREAGLESNLSLPEKAPERVTDALRTKSVRSIKKSLARKNGDARSYEAALRTPASKQVDEILTIVSFDGNEVEELRRSIREAEGRLLEMKTLGADVSQQMAFPYQQDFRQSQVVSQGWQIRAGVPIENVERFLSSLRRRPQLQILHRGTAPSQWKNSPGTQNFRINLVR